MVVVAVAGGAGHLGRTFVEVLKSSSKDEVVVLARKEPKEWDTDAPVRTVNYNDIDSTAKVLEDNGIHVLISTMSIVDAAASEAQINLIRAAAKTTTVKRFIASDWGVKHDEKSPIYPFREAAIAELRKTNLEWTRVITGYFMDYYGMPHVRSYMQPSTFVLDILNKAAAIPGTGNEPMTFIYTFDLAKYLVRFLALPEWAETTYCFGDNITWNEFLKLAEEARGSKFTVTHDFPEKFQRGEITELPAHVAAYPFFPKQMLQGLLALFGQYAVEGRFDIPDDKSLGAKFPEFQTMKVRDMVALWKSK